MAKDFWRCDACGQFISFQDMYTGKATRRFITPYMASDEEELETLCAVCTDKETNNNDNRHSIT